MENKIVLYKTTATQPKILKVDTPYNLIKTKNTNIYLSREMDETFWTYSSSIYYLWNLRHNMHESLTKKKRSLVKISGKHFKPFSECKSFALVLWICLLKNRIRIWLFVKYGTRQTISYIWENGIGCLRNYRKYIL